MQIRDRIKELRRVRAGDLKPQPKWWRQHHSIQKRSLKAFLEEVGYASALLVRELPDGSLQILDGNLRASLDPEAIVPVLLLDITEAEVQRIHRSFDAIGDMATMTYPASLKLTPELIIEIGELLPTCLYMETALAVLEVHRRAFQRWMQRGRAEARRLEKSDDEKVKSDEALYLQLYLVVRKALAKGEIFDLESIRAAAAQSGNWTAAAWRLERRFPDRWGRGKDELKQLQKDLQRIEQQLGIQHGEASPTTAPSAQRTPGAAPPVQSAGSNGARTPPK